MNSLCIATVKELSPELQEELNDTENLFSKLQQKDGGFVGRLGETTSDLYYSFFAIETFKMIEKEKLLDRSGLKDFLFSCYNKNGGFGYRKDAYPDMIHTFCGIGTSIATGNFDELDIDKISKFILSLQSTEGGFLKDEKSSQPTAYSTFYGIFSLNLLDKSDLLDKEFLNKTSEFLINLKTPEGGFKASYKSLQPNLVETASALFSLYLLDYLNRIDEKQVKDFVLNCQSNAGFKNHLRSRTTDLASFFCGVNSLTLLECLNTISASKVTDSILNFKTPWGGFGNMGAPDIEYTYYAIYTMILLSRER
ncbi:MAG: hypothetical protein FIB07_05765 [Candidatus Methanoperedens sp.]|nr:hypothetical protein [Candidatus Methanoperedens sp.]